MDPNELILKALMLPTDAIQRFLLVELVSLNPGALVVEALGAEYSFSRMAAKDLLEMRPREDLVPSTGVSVYQGEISENPQVGWWEIQWQGLRFELVLIHLLEGSHRRQHEILIGPDKESVSRLMIAKDNFDNDLHEAVLVYQDGCWSHSSALYEDIQNSTFDNLVLPAGISDQIKSDIGRWLESKELYEQHGIPWKRGMILVGPPGNGKTHLIKALVNHFGLNALYVRGFSSEYGSDSGNISEIFQRARACAPAMIILEDLDTLVTPKNRSHFLNELDGFASNSGILTIASANDPARLDPALVNRPSRFDRRYVFECPAAKERSQYLQFFTQSLAPGLKLDESQAGPVADATDGFSYAYLKELVLSSMMAWIDQPQRPFAEVLVEQVGPLRDQMSFKAPEPTAEPEPETED
ncbi:MAG: AAA family ATPase [Fimbriimonas sp.]